MDFNLFGQSLVTCLALLSAGLTSFLITQMKSKRNVPRLFGISVLGGFAIQVGAALALGPSANELPSLLWLLATPWLFSMSLVFEIWQLRKRTKMSKKKRKKTRRIYLPAVFNILACLLLALTLLNGYYRYYPTFNSLIGHNQSTLASLDSNGQVIVQYNANSKSVTNNSSTLESSLYGNSSTPTQGQLYSSTIPGTISKFHARNAWVYIPAIANADPNALNLPVLVLLAGSPGAPTDWLHGVNLVSTMDAFAKQHHGITPLVVVPDDTGSQFNDTECVNSPRGNVETYLTQDVPNYIKAHFPASTDPTNWAIGGLSMGGTCATMLSLVHPNIYHNFLDMGGESGPNLSSADVTIQMLFHGSAADWQAHQPQYLLAHRHFNGVGGFFASGTSDDPTTINNTKQLYLNAKQAGLNTVYETVKGPHTFNVFSQIFKDSLPWLSNRVGATSCSGATTCS